MSGIGWISVNERLPSKGQRVVFADIIDSVIYSTCAGEFHEGDFVPDLDGLEASNYDGGAMIYLQTSMNITHWMPLPEAPIV